MIIDQNTRLFHNIQNQMLLIISDKFDTHTDFVQKKLNEQKISNYRLNVDKESLLTTEFTKLNNHWVINNGEKIITTTEINAVWCRRPFVHLNIDEKINTSTDFKIWKNEWNRTLLGLYTVLENKIWLNKLRETFRGENKYFQMIVAEKVGLEMPASITSNNKEELLNFARKYKYVAFKVMEQEIYIDQESNLPTGLYANKITHRELMNFKEKGENPIFLQEYIEKDYEVRYTVVGEDHFVCKIDSQKSNVSCDDWRKYDLANTPHTEILPPKFIKEKIIALMRELNIKYGALDFIVTKNGDWIFLEINCMGQWLWIEQLTGMKISDSIVKWVADTQICHRPE